ncbi:hypothetical protein, partial [Komagataeibacter swingsii]
TKWFHLRPLGIRQYEAIHTDLQSHPDASEKHNSQQALVNKEIINMKKSLLLAAVLGLSLPVVAHAEDNNDQGRHGEHHRKHHDKHHEENGEHGDREHGQHEGEHGEHDHDHDHEGEQH